jgi:hypothetical protein
MCISRGARFAHIASGFLISLMKIYAILLSLDFCSNAASEIGISITPYLFWLGSSFLAHGISVQRQDNVPYIDQLAFCSLVFEVDLLL